MRGRRRRSFARGGLSLIAGVFLVLSAASAVDACGAARTASRPADQTGYVLAVTPGARDASGTMLIGAMGTNGDASVTITAATLWRRDSRTIAAPPLSGSLVGTRVAVKFTGPVAESYPVQATAAWIRLLSAPPSPVAVSPPAR
jgi:hypothetical protein